MVSKRSGFILTVAFMLIVSILVVPLVIFWIESNLSNQNELLDEPVAASEGSTNTSSFPDQILIVPETTLSTTEKLLER